MSRTPCNACRMVQKTRIPGVDEIKADCLFTKLPIGVMSEEDLAKLSCDYGQPGPWGYYKETLTKNPVKYQAMITFNGYHIFGASFSIRKNNPAAKVIRDMWLHLAMRKIRVAHWIKPFDGSEAYGALERWLVDVLGEDDGKFLTPELSTKERIRIKIEAIDRLNDKFGLPVVPGGTPNRGDY
jgi:hypothetical protein